MAEVLTGKQLRDRAAACLDQRKPDRDTLRSWIGRGADRIDSLIKEVDRLKSDLDAGGSEAALMMLEDARKAADNTLDRVHRMEASTEAALEQARIASEEALEESRANAETAAEEVLAAAVVEAADIVESASEVARQHVDSTKAACQEQLNSAIAQTERVDEGCRNLVAHANALDGAYRKRISDIRTEANALVSMMERFDALPISTEYDHLENTGVVEELVAEILDLTATDADDHGLVDVDLEAEFETEFEAELESDQALRDA